MNTLIVLIIRVFLQLCYR